MLVKGYFISKSRHLRCDRERAASHFTTEKIFRHCLEKKYGVIIMNENIRKRIRALISEQGTCVPARRGARQEHTGKMISKHRRPAAAAG